jgi:hypothetical protein
MIIIFEIGWISSIMDKGSYVCFFHHGDATTNYLFNICSKCKLPFIILSNWCHIKFFVKIEDDGIKMKL